MRRKRRPVPIEKIQSDLLFRGLIQRIKVVWMPRCGIFKKIEFVEAAALPVRCLAAPDRLIVLSYALATAASWVTGR